RWTSGAFPREHHPVSNGETDVFDSSVFLHAFIELHDLHREVVFWVDDAPAPQNVVGYDQSTGSDKRNTRLPVVDVVFFVGVDKDHVDWTGQSLDCIEGRTHSNLDL